MFETPVITFSIPSSRRIFTSHSRNISRIEKCQKSETIGLMKDNFESSTFSLTASDGRQRYAIFIPSGYMIATPAAQRHAITIWHGTIYKSTAKVACNLILKIEDQLLE